jgi:Flp pilus assembly protein TadB
VFNLLRNPRRRTALQYLLERERKATRSELAEHIAAIENDVTAAELNSAQRKRVYVSLYQNHLPKMDEYGVIRYDAREGTAELTSEARVLAHYLDADVGESDSNPWERYYPLLGLFGGISLAMTSLDRLVGMPLDVLTAVFVLLLLLVPLVAIDMEFL